MKFISQNHHQKQMKWGIFKHWKNKTKQKKIIFFIIKIYKHKALPSLHSQISKESFIADKYNFLKKKKKQGSTAKQ